MSETTGTPTARSRLPRFLGALPLHRVLDLVLPPRCLACGELVEIQGTLCAPCWSAITFVTEPQCRRCGLPFAFETDRVAPGHGEQAPGGEAAGSEGYDCGACLAEPPPYGRARAVMRYDEASRPLLLSFKHGDRTESADPFAAWMARSGAELLKEAELIAPVPLHWRRLLARRYNQAALLARPLARHHGLTAVPDLLLRRRATPSQGRLSRAERQRNVAGAFAVNPARAPLLVGRRLLLVDDVMTTGATVAACARAALRAGAASVDVLVLARAVRD